MVVVRLYAPAGRSREYKPYASVVVELLVFVITTTPGIPVPLSTVLLIYPYPGGIAT
jgi:hypothetical protein